MTTTTRRTAIAFTAVVAVALAAAFAVRTLWHTTQSRLSYPHCTVGRFEITTDQASVAAEMVGAVTRFTPTLPPRAAVLALAAGLQESKLTNLGPNQGDRDSVGVLQQRPSQGWGGGQAARLTDVGEATREFLAALVKHRGWRTQPLAEAIQRVQISADGSLYAQHEPEATALATALLGRAPAAIACTFAAPTLVASPGRVARLLREQLPVNRPSVSAHGVRVPGAGWQTTAWLVANADRLGIDSVAYAGRTWSRADGWTRDTSGATSVQARLARIG